MSSQMPPVLPVNRAGQGKWSVRPQGEKRYARGLTFERVCDGLRSHEWSGEDEVRGPGDKRWWAMAEHPLVSESVPEPFASADDDDDDPEPEEIDDDEDDEQEPGDAEIVSLDKFRK